MIYRVMICVSLTLLVLPTSSTAEPITVDRITVVDGDTIDVAQTRFRMIGYDTPESSTPRRKVGPNERKLAYQATQRLQTLLRTGSIDLREEPCACTDRAVETGKCNFGRKCAVLSVNGINVGDTLIKEGLARSFVCGVKRCPKLPDWPKILGDQAP